MQLLSSARLEPCMTSMNHVTGFVHQWKADAGIDRRLLPHDASRRRTLTSFHSFMLLSHLHCFTGGEWKRLVERSSSQNSSCSSSSSISKLTHCSRNSTLRWHRPLPTWLSPVSRNRSIKQTKYVCVFGIDFFVRPRAALLFDAICYRPAPSDVSVQQLFYFCFKLFLIATLHYPPFISDTEFIRTRSTPIIA